MNTTPEHNKRIAEMTFASVYPYYVAKIERKGRTKKELAQVIEWLTEFDAKDVQSLIKEKSRSKNFLNGRDSIRKPSLSLVLFAGIG